MCDRWAVAARAVSSRHAVTIAMRYFMLLPPWFPPPLRCTGVAHPTPVLPAGRSVDLVGATPAQESRDCGHTGHILRVIITTRHVDAQAAYLIRYDHEPEPGFKRSDRVFTTGIQIVL